MNCLPRFFPIVIVFIILFSGNAHALDQGIKIFIVDENDDAFSAETVRWWYAGKRNTRYELKCLKSRCDQRFLKEDWRAPIVISADAPVVEPEDASCWKLYHGEIMLDSPVKELKIVLHYTNKICK